MSAGTLSFEVADALDGLEADAGRALPRAAEPPALTPPSSPSTFRVECRDGRTLGPFGDMVLAMAARRRAGARASIVRVQDGKVMRGGGQGEREHNAAGGRKARGRPWALFAAGAAEGEVGEDGGGSGGDDAGDD